MRSSLTTAASALALALVSATFVSPAQASDRYAVSFSVSKTSVTKGQRVTVSGAVSPKAAGKEIRFQTLVIDEGDERWTTVRTATIRSDGTYSRKITPSAGIHQWRAYKPSGSGHRSGKSRSVTIKTYSWYAMTNADETDLAIASGSQWLGRYGPITVAGRSVSRYFATNQLGGDTTRWYTRHACKRIRVEVGLWDESDPAAVGQFRVFANSVRIASVRVPFGTTIAVEKPFSAATTGAIKFTGEAKPPVVGPTAIVASHPTILCTTSDSEG